MYSLLSLAAFHVVAKSKGLYEAGKAIICNLQDPAQLESYRGQKLIGIRIVSGSKSSCFYNKLQVNEVQNVIQNVLMLVL